MGPRHVKDTTVLLAVHRERLRQEDLVRSGKFTMTCAHPDMSQGARLGVLMEEVGEVARALNDFEGIDRLREELTQVAAVAVAWIEALNSSKAVTP